MIRRLGAKKRLINGEGLIKLNILPRVNYDGILTVLLPEIRNYANRKNVVFFICREIAESFILQSKKSIF